MKLALIGAIALLSGCATTGSNLARDTAKAKSDDGARCTLLGELVYNPRSGLIDPNTSAGPVSVYYVNPDHPFLVNYKGFLYQCAPDLDT